MTALPDSFPPAAFRICRQSALLVASAAALLMTPAGAEEAAYIHVVKNDAADTRFHLSELEAFADGVSPDEAGGASFGGMATSSNDISAAGTHGDGNAYPVPGTTTDLEHGAANAVPNNDLESGGAVWSTANGLGSNAQYTLDLGGTHDVTTVRLWPRADDCCSNRWRNLEIQLLDANLDPVPGSLRQHTSDAGNVPLEFTFTDGGGGEDDPIIHTFTAEETSVPPGTSVRLDWEVENADQILLDDVEVSELTTTTVAPLVTKTYTLTASNASGSASAQLTVSVMDAQNFMGASGRFVEVVKNDAVNTQLHLSEIEVFPYGVTPNEAHADGTSGNDLVQQSGTASVETPPTTTVLEQGDPASVLDGDLEGGTEAWTTRGSLGFEPRYMVDLGTTHEIGIVRLFGREDACCLDRLQNVTVNVYADDGSGAPGGLVNRVRFPGTAPAGSAGHAEVDLSLPDPGIRTFATDKSLIPAGESVTLAWVVNEAATRVEIDQGVGDVTARTDAQGAGSIELDPGPSATTIYTLTTEYPGGTSVASVSVVVTDQPLIYSFTADASLVGPGTEVDLTWETGNATALSVNGINVTGSSALTVTPAATTTYTLLASNANGSSAEQIRVQVVQPGEPLISEFLAENEDGELDQSGEASDWIEICNPTDTPASLNGYFLTDDPDNLLKWQFPDVTLEANDYLVVFATGQNRSIAGSELHTNFSLDSDGEYLALVKPDGQTVLNEFAPFPSQRRDVSYGFDPQQLREGYFVPPSPGAPNPGGFTGFVADTTFSVDRGYYTDPVEVEITSATPGAVIRYTFDGSKPTESTGQVYSGPLRIPRTVVLRAAAFKDGMIPTNVDTQTYIFPEDVISHRNMRTSITEDPVYGPQMEASLQAVPTVSLVFEGDVVRAEKEASVEFINFESGNTQVDAGMERFGNYVTNFAKRSMRLNFRADYGPKKLRFPIFEGHEYPIEPADAFDGLDLRSGNHDMNQRGAYLSNRFTDDAMMDMGQIAPHGRFVHVYLNGLYWGQYHLRERWNADMLAEYFGGSGDDYEAINANNTGSEFLPGIPFDGTGEYWNETRSLVAGPNPFANVRSHLDVPNVTDFMLLWVSGNSESEFRSAGSVPLGVPFKFFMKDADGFLRPPGHPVTHNGPINAMTELRQEGDPDYEMMVADRIHKHFFNDGALTRDKNVERLRDRMEESRVSFFAEAARWDFRTPASWQAYQDNLLNNHFRGLTDTMIGRFRTAGMYPALDAPTFTQHGGPVQPGYNLVIRTTRGTIYYTLDGSDPRVASIPIGNDPPTVLVPESSAKRVYIPLDAADGATDNAGRSWLESGFDDTGWIQGSGGVGFDSGVGDRYGPLIGLDVEDVMDDRSASCLIRIPFTPEVGIMEGLTHAELRVRYDDGYVAYLNGTEIARENFEGTPDGNSNASASHRDTDAELLQPVDISAHLGLIVEGQENVLALHGLNTSPGSSDFLISADLRLSSMPGGGGPAGAVSDTAIEYTGDPVTINERTRVRARVLSGSQWSALNEAVFIPIQDFGELVIAEFMYNPAPATTAEIAAGFDDSEDFEFLELWNTGAERLDLTGLRFTDGIAFDFTGSEVTGLEPGQRVLIVTNREAFAFRYGSGRLIAGEYSGKLKDEGETVHLVDVLDVAVRLFTYDNKSPWPAAAAGLGASLVLNNPETIPDHNLATNWRASLPGGTPGEVDVLELDFSEWGAALGISDPQGDEDLDGLNNFLEYVLLCDPFAVSTVEDKIVLGTRELDLGQGPTEYLTLTLRHRVAATDVVLVPEVSENLVTWNDGLGSAVLHRRVYHADGSATSTYRSASSMGDALRGFIRVRFESP